MVEAWARTVAATGDERHLPEETVLYTALQAHWKTFVSELEAAAEPLVLPAFVVAEVEALRCGILSQGLMLAKFRDCGWCGPVAFSCRRRGFWLSLSRSAHERLHESAEHVRNHLDLYAAAPPPTVMPLKVIGPPTQPRQVAAFTSPTRAAPFRVHAVFRATSWILDLPGADR
jgi:hypothetical protein